MDTCSSVPPSSFASSDSDTVSILLAHLPGFDKGEIDVSIDKEKTEICITGEGTRGGSLQAVLLRRLRVLRDEGNDCFSEVFQIPNGVVLEWIETWFNEEEKILVVLMPKYVDPEEIIEENNDDASIPEPLFPAETLDEPTEPEKPEQSRKLAEEISTDETPVQAPRDEDDETFEKLKLPIVEEPDLAPIIRLDEPIDKVPTDDTPITAPDEFVEAPKIPDVEEEDDDVSDMAQEMPQVELVDDNESDDLRLPNGNNTVPDDSNQNFQEEDEVVTPNTEPPKSPETANSTEVEDSDTNFEKIDEKPEINLPTTEPTEAEQSHQQQEEESEDPSPSNPVPEIAKSPGLEEFPPNFGEMDDDESQEPIKSPKYPIETEETDQNSPEENEAPDPSPKTAGPTAETLDPASETSKSDRIASDDDDPKAPDRDLAGKEEEGNRELGLGGDHRGGERRVKARENTELPLSPGILASGAFILSLVVLMFHFLKEKKRQNQ